MNDHIKSEISSYLAGVLPESRNRQIEAHAASCEKCRNALSKARAKQARVKREALKKASPDEMQNLFWDRQRKLLGMDTSSGGKTWGVAVLVLVVGAGGYWTYQKKKAPDAPSAPVRSSPDGTTSRTRPSASTTSHLSA